MYLDLAERGKHASNPIPFTVTNFLSLQLTGQLSNLYYATSQAPTSSRTS